MDTDPDAPLGDNRLESLLRDSRRLDDAPEALIQRAIGVWQPRSLARPAAAPTAAGALRRLVAVLAFDSAGAAPTALGLRSTGLAARQLLFTAEGHDVDLRLEPLPGGLWKLSGQWLGPEGRGSAELWPTAGTPQQVAWSALCEFAFEPVAEGRCRLLLRTEGWEIDIPELTLPP
jgi:hypothetical protein